MSIATVAAAALIFALVGGGASVAVAADPPTYQITAGKMVWTVDATKSCSFPAGECRDYDGGYRQSSMTQHHTTSATLVASPGEPVSGAAEVYAPLSIQNWEHGYSRAVSFSESPCGASGGTTTTDSAPTHDPASPSYLNAAIAISPNDAGVDVNLLPAAGTEPRFGWVFPTGMRWNDSSRYSTMTATTVGRGPSDCFPPYTGPASMVERGPFDPFTSVGRTITEQATTYESFPCVDSVCITRASGSLSWTYDSVFEGNSYAGGGSVSWTFDIAITNGVSFDDRDGDGITDEDDNCPDTVNTDQSDLDLDEFGDVCDGDIDGDNIDNEQETRIGTSPTSADSDGDSIPDSVETNGGNLVDTDGDGIADGADLDSDADGVSDAEEGTDDSDGDSVPDWRDPPVVRGTVAVDLVNDYAVYWYDYDPRFARRGSDYFIVEGSTTVELRGSFALLNQVRAVCVSPVWRATVSRNEITVPVNWTERGVDLMANNDTRWQAPPVSVRGNFASELRAKQETCANGTSVTWSTDGDIAGKTLQSARAVDFRALELELAVTVYLIDGRTYQYSYGDRESASKKTPKAEDIDGRKTFRMRI